MKLTWFGGTALRVYLGGEIIVVEPDAAPDTVDRSELMAGADRVVGLRDDTVPLIDPSAWRPKRAPRAIDPPASLEIARLASRTLLLAAAGESPLVILGGAEAPRYGRWADGAVIVLTSDREAPAAEATVLLDVARPRLVALAVEAEDLDELVGEIGEHLQGVGLVSLEPGLAVEV